MPVVRHAYRYSLLAAAKAARRCSGSSCAFWRIGVLRPRHRGVDPVGGGDRSPRLLDACQGRDTALTACCALLCASRARPGARRSARSSSRCRESLMPREKLGACRRSGRSSPPSPCHDGLDDVRRADWLARLLVEQVGASPPASRILLMARWDGEGGVRHFRSRSPTLKAIDVERLHRVHHGHARPGRVRFLFGEEPAVVPSETTLAVLSGRDELTKHGPRRARHTPERVPAAVGRGSSRA